MAIDTYAGLGAAIQSYMMDRADLVSPTPDFITMGEGILNYGTSQVAPLRTREMVTTATITTTDGVGTLPSDYLQFASVVDLASPRRNLGYISPETSELYYPDRSSGNGDNFTIIGESIYAFPLTTNSISMIYYQAIPPLSASNVSNWLLTKHPQIYLRAALTMAAEWIKDDAEMAKQATLLSTLVGGMNQQNMVAMYQRASLMPRRTVA